MDVESHTEMSCSTRFLTQCKLWQKYAVLSVLVILITFFILETKQYTGWDLIVKIVIAWGAASCIVWWMWIMKKLYDIAHWWCELHHHVNTATQLLQETKADIKDIKRLSAPAS
jgi:hypothetical protein